MTEIVKFPNHRPSQSLEFQIGLALRPDPQSPFGRGLRTGDIEEARRLIPQFEPGSRPVDVPTLRRWFEPIAGAVRNPPADRSEFEKRIAIIAQACGDFPMGAFTQATLRDALQTFQFWPAVADVFALLKPHADAITGRLDALRRIAALRQQAGNFGESKPKAPPTDDEKSYVRSLVAALKADTRAHEQEQRRTTTAPPVTRDSQIAELRRWQELTQSPAPAVATQARTMVACLRHDMGIGAGVAVGGIV